MKIWNVSLMAIFFAASTVSGFVVGQSNAQVVTSATVQTLLQPRTLTALGTLKANQSVDITPRIAGQITTLNITDGKTTGKGDVLVKLDTREQQARVKEAEITLNDAKRQLASMKTLYSRRAISKDELDAQTAMVQRLAATLDSQKVTLDYHTIKAPFGGVLGFSDMSQGAQVSANQVITTLDDLSKVKISFELPEKVMRYVQPGTKIVAQTSVWPEQQFDGTVSAINPRINTNNLTFTSLAVISNADQKLRPGMPVRITIVQEPEQSVVIPARSVLFDGNKQYVYVIDDKNMTSRRFITVGRTLEQSITVVDGLSVGERIVDEGVVKARDGSPVRIANERFADDQSKPVPNREQRS